MTEGALTPSSQTSHADELSVLLELSSLLASHDREISDLLADSPALILRLVQHLRPAGTAIQWRGKKYSTGTLGPESSQLRATLGHGEIREGYIAVSPSPDFSASAYPDLLSEIQTSLDHAAAIITLSLEHRVLESECDALRVRRSLLERIISHSPVMAFIWEPVQGWPVLYVSDNIDNLGYQANDFLSGKINYEDIIHPEDQQRIATEVAANLDRGLSQYEQRYRVLTKSGEVRLVRDWTLASRDNSNKVISIEGIIQDITDLEEADELARKNLEIANNLYFVVDGNGIVCDANEKTCTLLEVSRVDLIGSNWLERFLPDDNRSRVMNYFLQASAGGFKGVQEYENDIVTTSGTRRRIHWYHSLEQSKNGERGKTIAFGADVTEIRQSEEISKQQSRLLMNNPNPVLRLNHDGDVLVANSAAQQLINDIANHGSEALESWKHLVSEASTATSNSTRELIVNSRTYVFMISGDLKDGASNLYGLDVTGEKLLTDRIRTMADNIPGAVFLYTLSPDRSESIEFMNAGCEQLWEISANKLNGEPRRLWEMVDPEHLPGMRQSVLDSAANLSHWAYEWRIRTESGREKWLRSSGSPQKSADGSVSWTSIVVDITETKKAQEAVAAALRKTIYVLSAALEARDPYTAGHEQRVTEIAMQIGREMNLEAGRLTGLELAAMVHDVGKIRVPAEILSKPGRLTKEEFELIKTHPAVGAELLKGIDFEWPITDIIRQHHERMDGSGYPNGLAGEDILLEARIIAVADTLEAMASHRPYRPGLGVEKASAEIKAGAGSRYDKTVALACLRLVEDGTINLSPARIN